MHVAISVAHAAWSPHRSGYEYDHPSAAPPENALAWQIAAAVRGLLADTQHTCDVVEKADHYNCRGACAGGPCSRYAAAMVAASKAVRGADLVIETHCNWGPPGRNGALALCTSSSRAKAFSEAWLSNWIDTAPIGIAGRGVYAQPDVDRLFGKKWMLRHAGPHVAILELGYASSATDSAYLSTMTAPVVAANAVVEALRGAK